MSCMAPYDQKLDLVKKSLIKHCRKCISDNWDKMFDMWLSCDAGMEFGHVYINEFKKEFSQYMNKDIIRNNLYIAGKNIKFAISAFMGMYDDELDLDSVLKFTEKFIDNQITDFDNWCDEISMAMYEETSEYEREFGEEKEKSS